MSMDGLVERQGPEKNRNPEKGSSRSERRFLAAADRIGPFPRAQLLPLQGKFAIFAGGS